MDFYDTLIGTGLACIVGARATRLAHDYSEHLTSLVHSRAATARVSAAWGLCTVLVYALFWSWKHEGLRLQERRAAEGKLPRPAAEWMTREQWLKALAHVIVAHTIAFKSDDFFERASSGWVETWIDPGLSTLLVMSAMTVYLISDDNVGFISG